jgi:hypothetical protein
MPDKPQPSDRQLDALAELLLSVSEDRLDWIDREGLRALDIDDLHERRLLRDTDHTGRGGRPVIPADEIEDRIGMIEREDLPEPE